MKPPPDVSARPADHPSRRGEGQQACSEGDGHAATCCARTGCTFVRKRCSCNRAARASRSATRPAPSGTQTEPSPTPKSAADGDLPPG